MNKYSFLAKIVALGICPNPVGSFRGASALHAWVTPREKFANIANLNEAYALLAKDAHKQEKAQERETKSLTKTQKLSDR